MRRFSHFLRHKAFRWAHLTHDLYTGVHIEIKTPMEWGIYNDIFVDGDYDEPILRVLTKNPGKPLKVLDLGSNVGFFILRLIHLAHQERSSHFFHIRGVEASDTLCAESRRRLRTAPVSHQTFQINIDRGLIGQPEGQGTLYAFKDHGLNSVFRINGKPERVPFLNLSNLVSSWEEIDLMKCDIEGAELSFLENYSDLLRKTRSAVFEFHPEFCDYGRCLQLIMAEGFRNQKIVRTSPHARIELFWK